MSPQDPRHGRVPGLPPALRGGEEAREVAPTGRSWLLVLFPAAWRRRYGDEVGDHLVASGRPGRDRLDLVAALGPVWMDELPGRLAMKVTRITAAVLAVLGTVTTAWAVSQLQDGLPELPGHWWSTAAVVPLLAAVVVALTGELLARPPST